MQSLWIHRLHESQQRALHSHVTSSEHKPHGKEGSGPGLGWMSPDDASKVKMTWTETTGLREPVLCLLHMDNLLITWLGGSLDPSNSDNDGLPGVSGGEFSASQA
jgi:hypothetical protein